VSLCYNWSYICRGGKELFMPIRIKNYQSSAMAKKHLSELALFSIEKALLKEL